MFAGTDMDFDSLSMSQEEVGFPCAVQREIYLRRSRKSVNFIFTRIPPTHSAWDYCCHPLFLSIWRSLFVSGDI